MEQLLCLRQWARFCDCKVGCAITILEQRKPRLNEVTIGGHHAPVTQMVHAEPSHIDSRPCLLS